MTSDILNVRKRKSQCLQSSGGGGESHVLITLRKARSNLLVTRPLARSSTTKRTQTRRDRREIRARNQRQVIERGGLQIDGRSAKNLSVHVGHRRPSRQAAKLMSLNVCIYLNNR